METSQKIPHVESFPKMLSFCISTSLSSLSCIRPVTPLPDGSDGKASAYNAGDLGSIPGLGRSPGEENGNPLQYSCLETPMNGGAY